MMPLKPRRSLFSSPILVVLSGEATRGNALLPLPLLEKGISVQAPATPQSERGSGHGRPSSRRAQEDGAGDNVTEPPSLGVTPPTTASDLEICSVVGGLDLTRYYSSVVRSAIASAVEDAEFLREYITESMGNDGLRGGMSNLTEMASTLNWEMRKLVADNIPNWTQECHTVIGFAEGCEGWANLTAESTTLTSGLGWVDDRPDRRVERYVTSVGEPFVGTKQTDMDFIDTASSMLPWLVDRRSREASWYNNHQNGRSEGPNKDIFPYNRLYGYAWALSWGGSWTVYPPISEAPALYNFNIADVFGSNFDLWSSVNSTAPAGWPFKHEVPEGGTVRDAILSDPFYPTDDQQHYGNFSDVTALAPIYFTGEWRGFDYNDTFLGTVGVDVRTEALSWVFNDLEDGLCEGSFALLADANTFKVISISSSTVEKIFPERTGTDEKWIVPEDRRNQSFTVRDTLVQGLDDLDSANWTALYEAVQATPRGERDQIVMELTVTGEVQPREYYAMFDRWSSAADYVMLVFAPVEEVLGAVHPVLEPTVLRKEIMHGNSARVESSLRNNGTLGFSVSSSDIERMPAWLELINLDVWREGIYLNPGESVSIEFSIDTKSLSPGRASANFALDFVDSIHSNCFYNETIVHRVSIYVTQEPDLNQLSMSVRIGGLSMCAVALATAVAFVSWTWWFRNDRVVRASQPPFLIMICSGCFIMASTIIPLSIDDGVASQRGCDIACMATPWLGFMGFVTIFAALFSKIWRINKIFGEAKFRRITVKEKDVLVPFAVLFLFNFVFLLCWTLVDPLKWQRVPTGEWSSRGQCESEGVAHFAFLVLCVVTNILALILACYEAYRARRIDDEYSESKWIAISLVGMLQVCVLAIPLLVLVWEDRTATFFTITSLIFVASMSILLLMFVPKMIFMRKKEKEEAKKKADKLSRANNTVPLTTHNNVVMGMTKVEKTDKKISPSLFDDASPGIRITHMESIKGSKKVDLFEDLRRAQAEAEAFKEENGRLKALLRRHEISFDKEQEETSAEMQCMPEDAKNWNENKGNPPVEGGKSSVREVDSNKNEANLSQSVQNGDIVAQATGTSSMSDREICPDMEQGMRTSVALA